MSKGSKILAYGIGFVMALTGMASKASAQNYGGVQKAKKDTIDNTMPRSGASAQSDGLTKEPVLLSQEAYQHIQMIFDPAEKLNLREETELYMPDSVNVASNDKYLTSMNIRLNDSTQLKLIGYDDNNDRSLGENEIRAALHYSQNKGVVTQTMVFADREVAGVYRFATLKAKAKDDTGVLDIEKYEVADWKIQNKKNIPSRDGIFERFKEMERERREVEKRKRLKLN